MKQISRLTLNLAFLQHMAADISSPETPWKLSPPDSRPRPASATNEHPGTSTGAATPPAAGGVPDSAAPVGAAAAEPEATAHDQQFVAAAQKAAAACDKDALESAMMQHPELAPLMISHDPADLEQLGHAWTRTGVDLRELIRHGRRRQFATVPTLH